MITLGFRHTPLLGFCCHGDVEVSINVELFFQDIQLALNFIKGDIEKLLSVVLKIYPAFFEMPMKGIF